MLCYVTPKSSDCFFLTNFRPVVYSIIFSMLELYNAKFETTQTSMPNLPYNFRQKNNTKMAIRIQIISQ